MKRRTLWAITAMLGLTAPLAAADWPQFRGPGGRAVSEDAAVPVAWGPDQNIRWKIPLPGRGVSGPVILGGRLFLTASSGYRDRHLHVLCFDAASGKRLWERQLAPTGSTTCNPKTCMAAPTPAADRRAVYALFACGDLAAFDHDGNLLWYRSLAGDYPDAANQVGMAASPVVAGDTLLLPMENPADSYAAGLDVRTGKNRWKHPRAKDINWVTPMVAEIQGKRCAVFQTSQDITAYDPDSGEVRWRFSSEPTSTVPSPLVSKDTVFVAGGQYLALRPTATGAPEVLWLSNKMGLHYASPIYYQERIYGLTSIGLSCIDAANGKFLWQERARGLFWASPLVIDGKVYVTNEEGLTLVIQTGDKPKVLARNELKDTILATPAVADGALYFRSNHYLYCIARPAAGDSKGPGR
jgi:outer membrane protein assembly factor BamB